MGSPGARSIRSASRPALPFLFLIIFLSISCKPQPPAQPASSPQAPAAAAAPPASALPPGALPVYGAFPAFSLISQEGAPFSRESLRGKVWITDFFFTTCAMACPLLTARMGLIQKRLAGADPSIGLLSISIAPATDTPPVLKNYAARYHQDPSRWTFLTGVTDPLQMAATEGYSHSPKVDANTGTATGFLALHGQVFELIDGDGRIRGYYSKSDEGLDNLLIAAKRLALE